MRLLWNADGAVSSFAELSARSPIGKGYLIHNQSPEIQYTVTGELGGGTVIPVRGSSPYGPFFPYKDDSGTDIVITEVGIYNFVSADAYHGVTFVEAEPPILEENEEPPPAPVYGVNVDISYI